MSEADTTNRDSPRSETTSPRTNPTNSGGWPAILEYIKGNKICFVMAITRTLTVLCTLSYFLGFTGPAANRFKQALLFNAATSSLRLHQRMPPPVLSRMNREYLTNLIREDSFHYLVFPLMFFFGQPLTMALLPCALYAIFNLGVYSVTLLDKYGSAEPLRMQISNLIAKHQQNILHTIALSEIALLPIVVVGVFTRASGFMVPFMYYRFLLLRYNSVRNAHLKLLVAQIKAYASRYMNRQR